jgi:small conductance mechanosensitive channel
MLPGLPTVDEMLRPEFLSRVGLSFLVLLGVLIIASLALRAKAKISRELKKAGAEKPKKSKGGAGGWLMVLAVLVAASWLTASIWGVDPLAFVADRSSPALSSVARGVVILIVGVAAWELTGLGARMLVARIAKDKGDRRRAQKVRTIAPVIAGAANAVIVFVAGSMILSEAGIQIAPLLAGAGVVGIAIGFGAQSLVKDLFTGMFLILEDIVSHGDIVEIGGVSGTVEAMTLRTIRLRSYDGVLHIFPYSEAQVIHNKTASFSRFAFEIQVSYLSDMDAAIDAVKRAGEATQKSTVGAVVSAPVEVAVDKLSDNGVVLKGRIRTMAGAQGDVGAVFLKAAKEELDKAGVMIAHRHLPIPTYDTIEDRVAAGDGHDAKAREREREEKAQQEARERTDGARH